MARRQSDLLIAVVVIGMIAVAGLQSLPANLSALAVLRASARGDADLGYGGAPRPVVAAALLAAGRYSEAEDALSSVEPHGAAQRRFHQYLLGRIREGRHDLIGAVSLYESAGLLGALEERLDAFGPALVRDHSLLVRFGAMTLALARESIERGDDARAYHLSRLARRILSDRVGIAEAYEIEGRAELNRGDAVAAITTLRRSLDTLPPDSVHDPRLRLFCEAAGVGGPWLARQPGLLSLLPLYCAALRRLPQAEIDRLALAALAQSDRTYRPFVTLRRALVALRANDMSTAGRLLAAARADGLPAAWMSLLGPIPESGLSPSVVVQDDSVLGYEIDPIQVELGLPLDLLLVYRNGNAGVPRAGHVVAVLHEGINLAPDPGFQYRVLEESLGRPSGAPDYEADPYGATGDVHLTAQVSRPGLPEGAQTSSPALVLDNAHNALRRSGVESLSRAIHPDARYLHAGWIRASGGMGYIGRLWLGGRSAPKYDYATAAYGSDKWTHVAQVVSAPPEASAVRLWLLNYESAGTVAFDEILFVELPR